MQNCFEKEIHELQGSYQVFVDQSRYNGNLGSPDRSSVIRYRRAAEEHFVLADNQDRRV